MAAIAVCNLASGAHPATTFPNQHLLAPAAAATTGVSSASRSEARWSAPKQNSALEDLRAAVQAEDWDRAFAEGLTKIHMRADWAANAERCSALRCIANSIHARRVLEIGSFCGVASLALAERMPADGEVQSLELDPFVVAFGRRFHVKSLAGRKISTAVGHARDSLQALAAGARVGCLRPFDFVVLDADKDCMREYFDTLWSTPGLLREGAIVCVDMIPHKGQPPLRYVKFGFPHRWESSSGQAEIDALRSAVAASPDFVAHEFGGLLIVRRVPDWQ
mmetsp:Transcript_88297/g.248652  ORF Transcript_88297/g.248652 Transcript_88297/m.248652 type:complete len:278 (-) Transcript_88297:177-1010(-)|eukprot:CAMPEP_0117552684 /NCGR_PEP_ID=MMETSP0784-20121206/49835_1 /TAXON_ID=39447 /ORGANISM="" /LENGTH=277 /DNA_ID=CAMNT_0005349765 /DNA_START=65 /DNA_END=898 /DNA_ORIENTATION=+